MVLLQLQKLNEEVSVQVVVSVAGVSEDCVAVTVVNEVAVSVGGQAASLHVQHQFSFDEDQAKAAFSMPATQSN